MANAFFLPLANLFASLQGLASFFAGRPGATAYVPERAPVRTPVWQGPVRQPPARPQPAKALRIVRVVEPCASRAVAGRMVISGRMADVCAELDRLAALEAGNDTGTLARAVGWR
ncbi:hypothetical protein H8N03_20870 [Ramlibacter sp. USB13]|uniref:Uncharacterized protein n=1 Tax=Ramlibacter cellulosilyticus TaxID=2764187 RepID=A0A923SDK0_9BURK|nr:hypothetical protein [Ramlibacter cellulosilyticus]MBC5785413.1 hypothetical protein [Ramlibacter cellulosilyticus]